ncbi:MAG: glycosyltransferase family 2 protein [Firmicutes bacterium]|nr:glycosyltransferase family 2 protein [Bacillota bacterium]
MMLSVVVPCYNEEKVIEMTCGELLKNLKEITDDFEIIFVNDGSSDKTIYILKALAESDGRIKYISFSRNFGKEAAMLAGLKFSSGEYTVIMDADLQHPPELIAEMLNYAQSGYDQVIARRNRKGDSAGNTFFAKMYYRIVNRLTDVELIDGVGDFRMLSRKAVDALLSLDEYNRFSKGLFSWIGFKEKIINYENRQRAAGKTKWNFRALLRYGIDGVLSFNNKPLRYCFVLGAIAMGISFGYLIWLLLSIAFEGIDQPGYFTTIFTISLFGGIQLISIGVIGEYIGRIYYEVKHRPHFLVDETNFKENHQRGRRRIRRPRQCSDDIEE